MKTKISRSLFALPTLLLSLLLHPIPARAHCDSLDGPVVKAAARALAEHNINHALIWVRSQDEFLLKQTFEKALSVRKLGVQARELAGMYFFETVVRLHRAGEGAPYTGLKPAGRDLGPAIPAADAALKTANCESLTKLLSATMERNLHEHFQEALAKQNFDKNDLKAGRAYVAAYVSYIHYVAELYQAAAARGEGHFSQPERGTSGVESHHAND